MSALSNLGKKALKEIDESTSWDIPYHLKGVVDSIKSMNIALDGNYYFATVCGDSVDGGTEINLYCYDSLESVMSTLEDHFKSNSKGYSYYKSFYEGYNYFTISCVFTTFSIKLMEATEWMVDGIDQESKILSPEFLLAEEIVDLYIEKKVDSCLSPKARERFINVVDNKMSFDTTYVRKWIECMAGDPDAVCKKALDNIEKFNFSRDFTKNVAYIRICRLIEKAVYGHETDRF